MGSSGAKVVKSVKYFNEKEILDIRTSKNRHSSIEQLTENIKLEFSMRNCSSGKKYSINVLFLEKEENNFTTEEKASKDNEISFDKFFTCDYYFGKEQNMQITIYKEDISPFIIITTLGEIIGSKYSVYNKLIENKEILIIKAIKLRKDKSFIRMNINIKNNDPNNNYLIKNKLIFEIKSNNRKIYSSETVSDQGNFELVNIPGYLLYPQYTVDFVDPNNNKIKASYTKLLEVLRAKKYDDSHNNLQIKLPISKDISLSIYDNSVFEENFSFFDLISSGLILNLSIGIDFTGSNGHPLDNDTLHCIITDHPNDYEKVIRSIGNILSNYNYKKLYPVYGFGAIINTSPYKDVSMCFNINFNDNPEIYTIENVINVYRGCLEKLTFAGPTYFSPIIKKVIENIRLKNNNLEYTILLILTDGVIDDIQETIDALVEGSFLPLSVIIVGIGNADFGKMVILDGNDTPLVSTHNIKWLRDLVQFIHYNKYKNNEQRLTKEILEEIPRQIVEYYTLNNYNPDKIKEIVRKNSIQNQNLNINYTQNINKNQNKNNTQKLNNNYPDLPTKSQIENKNNSNKINNNNNYNEYNNYNNLPNKYNDIDLSNRFNINNNNDNNIINNYNNINNNIQSNFDYNNNLNNNKNNANLNLNNSNIQFKDFNLESVPISETVVFGNINNFNNNQGNDNKNNINKNSYNDFYLFDSQKKI